MKFFDSSSIYCDILWYPLMPFLQAYKRMTERGYRISNLDVTLILQAPKVNLMNELIKISGLWSHNVDESIFYE
jgi:hypothetical protein